jgi:hypothetical protein
MPVRPASPRGGSTLAMSAPITGRSCRGCTPSSCRLG